MENNSVNNSKLGDLPKPSSGKANIAIGSSALVNQNLETNAYESPKFRLGKGLFKGTNNICIGKNAGIDITDESYQLRINHNGVEIRETMTEREYYLINSALRPFYEK